MASKIPYTKEMYLINNYNGIIDKLIKTNMAEYSILKLVDSKLVSKNFKTGLVFFRADLITTELKRLFKLLLTSFYKQAPYFVGDLVWHKVIDMDRSGDLLSVNLVKSKSNYRYLRMLGYKLDKIGLGLTIAPGEGSGLSTPEARVLGEYFRVVINPLNAIPRPTVDLVNKVRVYQLFDHLEDIIKVFTTIHRKAIFKDEQFRTVNQSRSIPRTPARAR